MVPAHLGQGGLVTAEIEPGAGDTEPEGSTPLDEDEAGGLIPTHLTNRGQLNAWEQANITLAVDWLRDRRDQGSVFDPGFLNELHRRMFGNTWRWAGILRRKETTIGVAPHLIPEAVLNLVADTRHWIAKRTYPIDEIAARFHHRLVLIHPFPNGNGRHARLAADVLLESLGAQRFSWGSGDLNRDGNARSRYLHALREGDKGSIEALLAFVRT